MCRPPMLHSPGALVKLVSSNANKHSCRSLCLLTDQTVTAECDTNYQGKGDLTATCNNDGTWTVTGTCARSRCNCIENIGVYGDVGWTTWLCS